MDQQIWLGILDSDRHYRYYSKLSQKFRGYQTWCVGVLVERLNSIEVGRK